MHSIIESEIISFEVTACALKAERRGPSLEEIMSMYSNAVNFQMFRDSVEKRSSCSIVRKDILPYSYVGTLIRCSIGALRVLMNLLMNCRDSDPTLLQIQNINLQDVALFPFPPVPNELPFSLTWAIGSDRFDLIVRVEFTRAVTAVEEEEIVNAVDAWDWIVANGGYPDDEYSEQFPQMESSEAYLMSPTIFEHPTYGLLANLESVNALINYFSYFHQKGCTITSIELA